MRSFIKTDPDYVKNLSASLAAGAVFGAVSWSMPAFAADAASNAPEESGWTITLKANGGISPAWEGSKNLSPYLLPGLSIRRKGSLVAFAAPDDAVSFALLDEGYLKAGPVGRLRGPRHQSEHQELRGIHDIDWTLEAGVFAEFWPMEKLRARVEVRHGFLGHHGNVADFYVDWVERQGPWTWSIGPRMTIGDTRYTDKLFGVNALESLVNGTVAPYKATGGVKSIGVMSALTYQWSPAWTTTVYVKYNRLTGSASESPIVSKIGSRNQFTFGAIVAYSFDWGGF